MNLETAYFVAQIVAAAAVIGTLLYGIIQIRINNRFALIQLTNDTQQFVSNFNLALGLDKQAARTWRDGMRGETGMEMDEKIQFNFLITSAFSNYEQHQFLYKQGLIAQEVFDRADLQLQNMLSQPGVQDWWPKNKMNFNSKFHERVDAFLRTLIEAEDAMSPGTRVEGLSPRN